MSKQTLKNGGPWWLISKDLTAKKFAITGPIDDDTEFNYKAIGMQKRGIEFYIETTPISKQSKADLISYFTNEQKLQLVSDDEIYKT